MSARAAKATASRYRSYFGPEKMRAAFMAGQGKNCGEIATELGGTTPRKVRDMLRSCGIKVVRPVGRSQTVPIHCTNEDMRRLDEAAAEREVDPGDLALFMIRALLAEPTLLDNLLDEEA